jgi:hypothetical protein
MLKEIKDSFLKSLPFGSKEQMWERYNDYINSLSQEDFDFKINDIIKMMNYGGKSARQYANSQEHLEVALKRWPRLATHKDELLLWIKECRSNAGLEM